MFFNNLIHHSFIVIERLENKTIATTKVYKNNKCKNFTLLKLFLSVFSKKLSVVKEAKIAFVDLNKP